MAVSVGEGALWAAADVVVVARTSFFDVRGEEVAVAAVFATVLVVAAAADCGLH